MSELDEIGQQFSRAVGAVLAAAMATANEALRYYADRATRAAESAHPAAPPSPTP